MVHCSAYVNSVFSRPFSFRLWSSQRKCLNSGEKITNKNNLSIYTFVICHKVTTSEVVAAQEGVNNVITGQMVSFKPTLKKLSTAGFPTPLQEMSFRQQVPNDRNHVRQSRWFWKDEPAKDCKTEDSAHGPKLQMRG